MALRAGSVLHCRMLPGVLPAIVTSAWCLNATCAAPQ
jgi:hypothetical protein